MIHAVKRAVAAVSTPVQLEIELRDEAVDHDYTVADPAGAESRS